MKLEINNRRYIGSKNSLLSNIDTVIKKYYKDNNFVLADVFAGTGVVGNYFANKGSKVIVNDLLYSNFVAGFFPKSYAMIWSLFTLLSPVLAFFCWYAKGKGWIAFIISAGILGFIINATLSYGMWYVDIRSYLHLLTLILGIIILHKSTKETICMFVMAIPIAMLLDILIPFSL